MNPSSPQDSDEYYISIQRMTEAMIKILLFHIFLKYEDDSVRSCINESIR